MKQRIINVLQKVGILLIVGCLYGIWFIKTNIGIPCPIRKLTGFKCPGCGISHMCVYLMQGQIRLAFAENPVVFCILPIVAIIIARQIYRYIRYTKVKMERLDNVMIGILIGILIVWGIVRNI